MLNCTAHWQRVCVSPPHPPHPPLKRHTHCRPHCHRPRHGHARTACFSHIHATTVWPNMFRYSWALAAMTSTLPAAPSPPSTPVTRTTVAMAHCNASAYCASSSLPRALAVSMSVAIASATAARPRPPPIITFRPSRSSAWMPLVPAVPPHTHRAWHACTRRCPTQSGGHGCADSAR